MASRFESAEHEREFAACLARREIPLKFAYAGSAAQTHDELARSAGYQEVVLAVAQEVAVLDGIFLPGPPIALCDVGPGNGVHSTAFLSQLKLRGHLVSSYLALDFSHDLLEICLALIQARLPDLSRSSGTWDFESGPTPELARWRGTAEPVLVSLLGHTIGNPQDPGSVLRHIRESCAAGDHLLISAALFPKHQTSSEILKPYLTPVFRAAALEPFFAAGVPRENLAFDVQMDGQDVIAEAIVLEDTVAIGVPLHRGERIHCFRSQRFTNDELKGLLEGAGWEVLRSTTDADASHAALIGIADA